MLFVRILLAKFFCQFGDTLSFYELPSYEKLTRHETQSGYKHLNHTWLRLAYFEQASVLMALVNEKYVSFKDKPRLD